MTTEELLKLSEQELQDELNKIKPSPIIDAFFIGFFAGIIIYCIVASTLGFLTLIPLFLIYLLLKKPKKYTNLKNELKRRNLQ